VTTTYAWYEIVGCGLLTALLIWFMFQALEWGLDRLLQYRVRKELDRLNRTAPPLPRRIPGQSLKDDGGA
jgi:hypothetical protein